MKQNTNTANNPTQQFYTLLQDAYEFFNHELFVKIGNNAPLPNCMITMQREKNTMGYFSRNRWVDSKGNKTHEIALNPAYFANHNVIEIFQTLTHEMCHLWQCEFGKRGKEKARTYHDKEWVDKMQQIGLKAISGSSNNGTGQKVWDEPIPDGVFYKTCIKFIKLGNQIKWIDRFPAATSCNVHTPASDMTNIEDLEIINYLNTNMSEIMIGVKPMDGIKAAAKVKQKSTYKCLCNNKVWGKTGMNIVCGNCHVNFTET